MDAVKFLEELKRMCGNTDSCEDCPIFGMKEDNCMTLTFPCFWDEAEIVSAVEEWSAEHPAKTRLMREILFRGKRTDNGEWVEGCLIVFPDEECFICSPSDEPDALDKFWVRSETVGQYTGMTDKNGKKIFEGDIVKDDWGKIYKVFYTLHSCAFMVNCSNPPNEYEKGNYRIGEAWCGTIKIIGNIHDNPELLEDKP